MSIRVNKLRRKYSKKDSGIPFSAMKTRKKPKRRRKYKKHKKKYLRKKPATKKKGRGEKSCQCGSHTYTGKEETPRGLGRCEECIPLNVMLKGKDGNLYENKEQGWVKA